MAGSILLTGLVAGIAGLANALPQTAIPVAISGDIPLPAIPTPSSINASPLELPSISLPTGPVIDPSSTVVIPPLTVSLDPIVLPGATIAPVVPILEQIGNSALSSIASDLSSILSVFSSAAGAISTTLPPVTLPSLCPTVISSFPTALPTEVDPGLGSILSSLLSQTTPVIAFPTATAAASSLTFSSLKPIVTSIDVSIPINIDPNVNLGDIVAGAANATVASLDVLSDAVILKANQTLALLTLLGNLNLGGLAALTSLTDLASVQIALKKITKLDLVTVVNALLSKTPRGKRDVAYLTTGLLDDPLALTKLLEGLVGTVEDIVSSTAYVILQQLGLTGLVDALEGVGAGLGL